MASPTKETDSITLKQNDDLETEIDYVENVESEEYENEYCGDKIYRKVKNIIKSGNISHIMQCEDIVRERLNEQDNAMCYLIASYIDKNRYNLPQYIYDLCDDSYIDLENIDMFLNGELDMICNDGMFWFSCCSCDIFAYGRKPTPDDNYELDDE